MVASELHMNHAGILASSEIYSPVPSQRSQSPLSEEREQREADLSYDEGMIPDTAGLHQIVPTWHVQVTPFQGEELSQTWGQGN